MDFPFFEEMVLVQSHRTSQVKIIPYPAAKRCAFAITDDTDYATFEGVKEAYGVLNRYGIKATKTVWVLDTKKKSGNPEITGKFCEGISLQDVKYLNLVKELQNQGHEIALHLASGGNNLRSETIRAYEGFKEYFGAYPRVNIMHGRNADNLYWGRDAFSNPLLRFIARLYCEDKAEGHNSDSPFFWGDICKKFTQFVRLYKMLKLNTLAVNPSMPYHDSKKKYVNFWFSVTDLSRDWLLRRNITQAGINRLIRQNGACIAYTYLHTYCHNGTVNGEYERAMELLGKNSGSIWFAPVSVLLERLQAIRMLSLKRIGGEYRLLNSLDKPVSDVLVQGPAGTKILVNGADHYIQPDGFLRISNVDPTGKHNISCMSNKNGISWLEEIRLLAHQIALLLVRHVKGRQFTRRGW